MAAGSAFRVDIGRGRKLAYRLWQFPRGIPGRSADHLPPIVFLHHATGSSLSWARVAPAVVRATGRDAIAIDRLGHGLSEPRRPEWSFDYHLEDAEDLAAFLRVLGVHSAALVGHSDGATLAILAAAGSAKESGDHGGADRGRARLSEGRGAFKDGAPLGVSGRGAEVLERLRGEFGSFRAGPIVLESPHVHFDDRTLMAGFDSFFGTLGRSDRFLDRVRRDHSEVNAADAVERWRQRWTVGFDDWDVSGVLDAVQCPTLVIHGEHDVFFPLDHSVQVAARISGNRPGFEKNGSVRCDVLTGVGHSPHEENDPEGFGVRVARFLTMQTKSVN